MKPKSRKSNVGKIAVFVSGLIGLFGGVPGTKKLFFDQPAITVNGFLPAIVFDEGISKDSVYPSFWLNGILSISNRNDFDVTLNEMKVYGRTKDSSGKYKFPGNKPVVYQLNLVGVPEQGEGIVKAHAGAFIRFKFAHFHNKEPEGAMNTPMKAVTDPELNQPVFFITAPSFNQLFQWNDRRSPVQLVNEITEGSLKIGVSFNGELLPVDRRNVYALYQCPDQEWGDIPSLIRTYNGVANLN